MESTRNQATDQRDRRRRAIVLGASFAGLTAAAALAEHFHEVVVLERDRCPEGAAPRKGVPQGNHIHILLRTGIDALDDLLPGFIEETRAATETLDFGADLSWKHWGAWKARFESGVEVYPETRPALEARLRRRVSELPEVEIRWGTAAVGPALDGTGRRVIGVELRSPTGGPVLLEGDLVVDATGRGSRTPAWLEAHGFDAPAEEEVRIGLAYTTGFFRRLRPAPFPGEVLFLPPQAPGIRRGGVIMPVDDERWVVTLLGYAGDHAPTELDGFREFARGLSDPACAEAIEASEPLSEIRRYEISRQVRRRYDRLRTIPEGLLVTGDAVCGLDPHFGQGMSMAALEAVALRDLLRRRAGRRDPIRGLGRPFQRRAARIAAGPWSLTSGEAFRFPEIPGKRPPGTGLLHWYGRQLGLAGSWSPRLHRVFIRVMHLSAGPASILRPDVVLQVLAGALRRRLFGSASRSRTVMSMDSAEG